MKSILFSLVAVSLLSACGGSIRDTSLPALTADQKTKFQDTLNQTGRSVNEPIASAKANKSGGHRMLSGNQCVFSYEDNLSGYSFPTLKPGTPGAQSGTATPAPVPSDLNIQPLPEVPTIPLPGFRTLNSISMPNLSPETLRFQVSVNGPSCPIQFSLDTNVAVAQNEANLSLNLNLQVADESYKVGNDITGIQFSGSGSLKGDGQKSLEGDWDLGGNLTSQKHGGLPLSFKGKLKEEVDGTQVSGDGESAFRIQYPDFTAELAFEAKTENNRVNYHYYLNNQEVTASEAASYFGQLFKNGSAPHIRSLFFN